MTNMGRRRFLASVGAGTVGLAAVPAVAGADADEGFSPSTHGFGFRNWRAGERAYPGHDHRRLANEEIRECVRLDWRGPFAHLFGTPVSRLPDALLGLLTSQIRVAAAQLSSTDGHCYGMAFSAQEFYENPDSLPDSVENAAALRTPEMPRGDGGTVGTRIDEYQSTQLLDVHSWLGRRRMLRPAKIDHAAEVAALTATIDAFGTAGVTLVDVDTRRSHQVLVYDYTETADATLLDVYNPNAPASAYRPRFRRRLKVNPDADRPVMNHPRFDNLVFNRWDRAIRADADVTAPRRTDDGDFSHLLERAVRFTVTSPNVSLAVVAPDGTPVGRNRADLMDRTRTEVYGTRYRYDAPAGDYRVSLVGRRAATYELTAEAAGLGGSMLDETVTAEVAPGEVREYVASVPENADGAGTLRERGSLSLSRARRAVDVPNLLAGAAGGAALSAYALRRRD